MKPELVIKLMLHLDVYPESELGPFDMNFRVETDHEAIELRTFFLLIIGHIKASGTSGRSYSPENRDKGTIYSSGHVH